MGLLVLENLLSSSQLNTLSLTKSLSACKGVALREAHKELGRVAAEQISLLSCQTSDYAVIILMRAGLNFGLGIADSLEHLNKKVSIHFVDKDGLTQNDLEALSAKKVLIVDAVVNTGKSVCKVINQLDHERANDAVVVTIVMPDTARSLASTLNIVSVRVSERMFKGGKVKTVINGVGPDTGDRLFGTY